MMAFTLTIPTLGKPKTVKDAVIVVLSQEWPLSARRIYIKVKSLGLDVTYQAVHKALGELIVEEVADRDGSGYKLSGAWIDRIRDFGNKLDASYKGKLTGSLENVVKTGYQSLSAETLYQYYKLMMDAFENYLLDLTKPDDVAAIYFKHMYWILSASDKEYNQFKRILSKRKSYIICNGNTHADKMLAKFFSFFNVNVKLGVGFANGCDFYVCGDYVVQIFFPEDIRKIIDESYRNMNNATTIKKFYDDTFHKKTEINITVMRNPGLAEQLRNVILSNFGDR